MSPNQISDINYHSILMGPLQHEKGGRGRVVVASSTLSPIMLSPARNGTLHSSIALLHSTRLQREDTLIQFSVTKTGTLNLSEHGKSDWSTDQLGVSCRSSSSSSTFYLYDGLPAVYHLIETKLFVSPAQHRTIS